MSNLQNINLLVEQNDGIFANRKAANLKEEKNKQGAFWPGYENTNITQAESLEIQTSINENEYNPNQLKLFTDHSTTIYDRNNKLHESSCKVLDKIFHRNLHNTSTKLLHEKIVDCFDFVDGSFNVDYHEVYLREYQFFNSYIFTVQYESVEYNSINSAYGEKYGYYATFTILKVTKI